MADTGSEARDDLLHVPNLFEFFCERTADDMKTRAGNSEAPAVSFASLILTILAAFAFHVFGRPALAKAAFVLFGVLLLWTIWGVVVRSSEQVSRKADNIRAGAFPPESMPFVLARLKWWNHLLVPQRWGRHSRLYDRRGKLERKILECQRQIAEVVSKSPPGAQYNPPDEDEAILLAERIASFAARTEYENEADRNPDRLAGLRQELTLYMALVHKINEMAERLDRVEKLSVVFQNVSPEDLSSVVSEATQVLEERRLLVLSADAVDPDDFIDLVTVRVV